MWPNSLARFPNYLDEAATLSTSRFLPSAFDGLCGRVVGAGGHFKTEAGVQVLPIHSELEPGKPPPLYIRLEGMVGQVALTPWRNRTG